MELLVHASTSGHLLVACLLEITAVVNPATATQASFAHVIMETLIPPLLLWAMTIFVRVHAQRVIGEGVIEIASIQMLHSGMARFVRVVAHAASSTIHHGSPKTYPFLPQIVSSYDCVCMNPITGVMWHLNCWNCTFSKHQLKVKLVQVDRDVIFKNQFELMLCTSIPHQIKTQLSFRY